MRALLDTHAFLWWMTDDQRLSSRARSIILDPESALLLSAACAWEIATKLARGRLRLPVTIHDVEAEVERQRIERVPVGFHDAITAGGLPRHHGDPFDRILVAQAQALGCPIVTRDPDIARYAVATIW
ncbi:MAG: type II toxin-antitoxin system VapC family toxin [Chloroflexota bacterium]